MDEQHVCAERRCNARSRKPDRAAAYNRHVISCTRHVALPRMVIRFVDAALIKNANAMRHVVQLSSHYAHYKAP